MMAWTIAGLALLIAAAALFIALRTAARYNDLARRVEQFAQRSSFQSTLDDVELTLDAMLSELEAKGKEVIASIESAATGKGIAVNHSTHPDTADDTADDIVPGQLGPDQKKRLVRQLFRQGLDTATIARQLGLGQGEVQLIIDLPES